MMLSNVFSHSHPLLNEVSFQISGFSPLLLRYSITTLTFKLVYFESAIKYFVLTLINVPLQKSPNTLGVSRKQSLQLLLSARRTLGQQVKILFGDDISEHYILTSIAVSL